MTGTVIKLKKLEQFPAEDSTLELIIVAENVAILQVAWRTTYYRNDPLKYGLDKMCLFSALTKFDGCKLSNESAKAWRQLCWWYLMQSFVILIENNTLCKNFTFSLCVSQRRKIYPGSKMFVPTLLWRGVWSGYQRARNRPKLVRPWVYCLINSVVTIKKACRKYNRHLLMWIQIILLCNIKNRPLQCDATKSNRRNMSVKYSLNHPSKMKNFLTNDQSHRCQETTSQQIAKLLFHYRTETFFI